VIDVGLLTTTASEASTLPNLIAVTSMKLVPLIVTPFPAAVLLGDTEVTVGAWAFAAQAPAKNDANAKKARKVIRHGQRINGRCRCLLFPRDVIRCCKRTKPPGTQYCSDW
jgi:hypothetical protein